MQLRDKIRIRLPLRAISTPHALNSATSSTFLEYLSSTESKLVTTTSVNLMSYILIGTFRLLALCLNFYIREYTFPEDTVVRSHDT